MAGSAARSRGRRRGIPIPQPALRQPLRNRPRDHRHPLVGSRILRPEEEPGRKAKPMNAVSRPRVRCAIYTRKSSEEGLEQSFNSLQAQREACEAYVTTQRHEGWQVIANKYDDG